MIFINKNKCMATINSRNESNKFIKQVGVDFTHKPSGATEDITLEILNVTTDKTFNIYSDEACNNLLGNFKVIFKVNDGVYVSLSNIPTVKLDSDINFKNNVTVTSGVEEKLLDWNLLNSATVINTTLKLA